MARHAILQHECVEEIVGKYRVCKVDTFHPTLSTRIREAAIRFTIDRPDRLAVYAARRLDDERGGRGCLQESAEFGSGADRTAVLTPALLAAKNQCVNFWRWNTCVFADPI